MELNKFIKERYPEIIEEFNRYNRKDELPPVGSRVKPLRNGFGRSSELKVIAHVKKGEQSSNNSVWGNDYIVLKGYDGEYLSDPNEWWKELKIVD